MKINKKLELGMEALAVLKNKNEPTRTEDLAKSVGTTTNFMEQVMRKLRLAGLVTSVRGPGGGYVLADSNSISALKVALAVGIDTGIVRFDDAPTSKLHKAMVEAYTNVVV